MFLLFLYNVKKIFFLIEMVSNNFIDSIIKVIKMGHKNAPSFKLNAYRLSIQLIIWTTFYYITSSAWFSRILLKRFSLLSLNISRKDSDKSMTISLTLNFQVVNIHRTLAFHLFHKCCYVHMPTKHIYRHYSADFWD